MEFHKKIYIYNIVHWIKNADKILKEEYYKENINNSNNKKLIVMEIDELFTYIKKPKNNKGKSYLDKRILLFRQFTSLPN